MAKKAGARSYSETYEKLALQRRKRNRIRRFYKLFFASVVAMAFFVVVWTVRTSGDNVFVNAIASSGKEVAGHMGFKLEKVKFEGEKYVGQEELVAKLDLLYGKPILAIDLRGLRQEVLKDSWVKDASIKRVLPGEIKISITERSPVAIWEYQNQFFIIDDEGKQLTTVDSPDVLTLPLVVGEGANQQVTKIFNLLKKENALFEQVQAAVRISGRRWNIVFANGIEVLLPENDLDEAWHKLARLNEEKQLLERAIKSVDLRVPDRIYIRTLNGQLVPDSVTGGSSA